MSGLKFTAVKEKIMMYALSVLILIVAVYLIMTLLLSMNYAAYFVSRQDKSRVFYAFAIFSETFSKFCVPTLVPAPVSLVHIVFIQFVARLVSIDSLYPELSAIKPNRIEGN